MNHFAIAREQQRSFRFCVPINLDSIASCPQGPTKLPEVAVKLAARGLSFRRDHKLVLFRVEQVPTSIDINLNRVCLFKMNPSQLDQSRSM